MLWARRDVELSTQAIAASPVFLKAKLKDVLKSKCFLVMVIRGVSSAIFLIYMFNYAYFLLKI